jgi:O-antigen/teichoic acid export membrane protein
MAGLKSLFKDTAIYGMSSIVGRFLNYMLVPLYTIKISAESGGYGIVTNMYAYTALLMVLLTYGMETTFFRFANKEGEDPNTVYGTSLKMVGLTSLLFIVVVLLFLDPIASAMGYVEHKDFVAVMFVCVAIDAFQCIPFDYLRYQKRPIKFAALKLLNIVMLITLNLAYFVFLPSMKWNLFGIYDDNFTLDVAWVFYINLFCSASLTLFLLKELKGLSYKFDRQLVSRMLHYAWPILILGVAGILNQTADKILFPYLYKQSDVHMQLGIYGAASKIAMIMAMITQAFRFAYEPFVFAGAKQKDSKIMYAKAMKFFIIFTLLAFLCVVGYMDILRHLIGKDYWTGLRVVPIVMAAEIMMGIYFNLSFWYKLIDKTIYGAIFSGIGCAVLILVNVVFVPQYGYIACAWGGFAGYATCMVLSYFVGQKQYPIDYPILQITGYVFMAAIIYFAMWFIAKEWSPVVSIVCNTILIMAFLMYIYLMEFRKRGAVREVAS